MKKYFLITILMTVIFSSCEEEKVIFDGSQTLVAFASNAVDLPIEINSTGSVEIPVDITTSSTSERTFNVSVVEDETTADPASYSFGTIVIPANAYNGTFVINGVDDNISTTPDKLVLKISEGSDFVTETENLIVNVFQVCPVDETLFTGSYLIEQISSFVDGPTLGHNTVVELTADGLTRSFDTPNYPNYCSTLNDFIFSLVCNEVVVPLQESNCSCNNGADFFGPALANATYNISDDSVFTITFSDDVQNDCGSTAQTSYRFTKQ